MAYRDFVDLPKGTASDEALCNKGFNIAKYSKYDGYSGGFPSMVYKSSRKINLLLKKESFQTKN